MIIISRAAWGAAPPLSALTHWPLGQPTGYTLHWEGAGGQADHAHCAAEVRSIQAYHQHNAGYIDIAYNWVICLHGVIYEGRPAAQYQSAAQRGGNPSHIAVCFMWGAAWHVPPQAKSALVSLIQTRKLPTIGHRDEPSCQTSCPGDENELLVHELPALVAGPTNPGHPGGTPAPLPPPPGGIHHPILAAGTRGPAVMELQRKLDGAAGQHLGVDGQFGPATKAGVVGFQMFFHLIPDGIAGPKTWGLLDVCAHLKGVH